MSTGVQISGLASGINWQNIINEIITADSAGMNQVQSQQNAVNSQVSALGSLGTDLTNLSASIFSLEDPSLYSGVTAASTTANSTWQINAENGTPPGNYTISVGQFASTAQLQGASHISQGLNSSSDVSGLTVANLDTATPVTAGTFTVDGQQVTVTTSESLQDVFNAISTATGGSVTAAYDPGSDEVTLSSSSEIVLGADNDTSNFLQVMGLENNGGDAVSSSGKLGSLALGTTLNDTNLATAITGTSGTGAGSFSINGVTIDYNETTDTVDSIINDINNSSAGVTASFDAANNRILLTNNNTGDTGIGVSDIQGNLMGALGLTSGAGSTLVRGSNAEYSIDDGPQQISASNVLTPADLGVTGLNVTVNTTGAQTIQVATDVSGIQAAIQTFITDFNQFQTDVGTDTQVTSDSSGNPVTSVLSSDLEVSDWANTLETTAFDAGSGLTGALNSLDSLGIDFSGTTGQLTISDESTLQQAISANPTGVAAFFQTANVGFGSVMTSAINDIINENTSDQEQLQSESTDLGNQITTMQDQLNAQEQQMESEFTTMETMISQYQSEDAALGAISGDTGSSAALPAVNNDNISYNGQSLAGTSSSSSTDGTDTSDTTDNSDSSGDGSIDL